MIEYLTVEDLVDIATEVLGAPPAVRDYGLLDSAAHRPQASAFGQDAYPTLDEKAAALLEGIARAHALIDGNKRLAWSAVVVFYGLNGYDIEPPSAAEAVEFVVNIVTAHPELTKIARKLGNWSRQRSR